MSSVKEVSKIIRLDLTDIPEDKIASAKKEVGDLLIEEILNAVGDGKSPVKGESWKPLKKEYADEFKGGNRTPTMQLYGDLLDSLEVIDYGRDAIKIGHFGEQAPKADGHNQLSLEAKIWAASKETPFPKRRYIPDSNQNFKPSIMREVNNILDSYREKRDEVGGRISDVEDGIGEVTRESISVGISDLFSDDVIELLFLEAQRRRR